MQLFNPIQKAELISIVEEASAKAAKNAGVGVWGATEQKVHLSPAPARKPLWRLVSSGKPSFCRTIASPFVIGV
ncbi:hypothetical protein N5K35_17070 [Pseudomonas sp. GD03651]|uniref:hypothetical protein n=1 Tax=Pseudomonas TaxID=286 RepID=UPI0011B4E347|nr:MULTISPECIES: hypothetical protein [Pseudomonas]MDH2185400.1 hypothetical protein [Pseudomonas sp. GD03651]